MSPRNTAEIPLIPGDPLTGLRQRSAPARAPDLATSVRAGDPPRPEVRVASEEVEVADITFEQFFRQHRDRVGKALALSIGDRDLAAEAVDEAMIRAYQHWGRVSSLDHPAAWVYRVGMNYSRSRFRRMTRKMAFVGRHQGDGIGHDTPFSDSIGDARLAGALAGLPLAQRGVVVSRVLLGLTEAETAAALGLRPGTVKSRLHRGLAALRHELDRKPFQVSPTHISPPTHISNDKELS